MELSLIADTEAISASFTQRLMKLLSVKYNVFVSNNCPDRFTTIDVDVNSMLTLLKSNSAAEKLWVKFINKLVPS